jgi:signal transduction histidine kinase
MSLPIVTVRVMNEQDVVVARQRARVVAALAAFDSQDQTRIATAVSEIARNAVMYGRGGRVEFFIEGFAAPQDLMIRVADNGRGISNLDDILLGRFQSQTGMGIGLQGARRLMDTLHIDTGPERGTVIRMSKALPRRAPVLTARDLPRITDRLAAAASHDAFSEVHEQNRELLETLDELRRRSDELRQLNRELEDTNRGVVALYAELDEKAEHLKRANQLKSTFLSHMSHEFRTPLNSIMALAGILLSRMDGPLTPEQEKQVGFISRAAQELTDMVNDLLDLAKVEAGKIEIYPSYWQLGTLFGTLRGMLRPLVATSPVQLLFEEPEGVPDLFTDEGKVAQILRNFISNAIKFTDAGEIRVSSSYNAASNTLSVTVSDTGIGIQPQDQARIFEHYAQVDSAKQRQVKGTGLGLPLSRKLAGLLGGGITMQSTPGVGSSFTLTIPGRLDSATPGSENLHQRHPPVGPVEDGSGGNRATVLVIDDEEMARYVVRKELAELPVSLEEARTGTEGLRAATERRPVVIVLDLGMPDMDGLEVLDKLKSNPATQAIPVVVHTSRTVTAAERNRIVAAGSALVGKGPAGLGRLRSTIGEMLTKQKG